MPAAHVVHVDELVAPVDDDAVPAAQLVQLDAPAAEYVPAPQVWHVADDVAPDTAEKVPAAQFVQVDAPAAE